VRIPLRSALVVAASVAAMLVAPSHASAYPSNEIEFVGHGWGHGRGLGQYGALGYAIDEDKPYSDILDHFSGGPVKGNQPDGLISVRLTAFDGKDIYVTAGAPFTIGSNTFAADEIGRIQRDPTTGIWTISRAPSLGDQCSGTFTTAEAGLSAAAQRFYAECKRVSNAKAKAELGWLPKYPSYREGLRACLADPETGR
jgi:hypothetical protein